MRRIATLTALAAIVLIPSGSATQGEPNLQPGPATINVTTRLTTTTGGTRVYDLFNRPSYRNRIGTAILACVKLAPSVYACHEYLRLTRGQIIAEGVISGSGFYRLAVTGGTGYYDNAGGTMTVVPTMEAAIQRLVLDLNAF